MPTHEKIRETERAKYNKSYYENVYWTEDFPDRKQYRTFLYDDPTHEKRFDFLSGLLTKNFEFHSVLDAGCGMGHVVRNLLAKGFDVKATEISDDAIQYYMKDLSEKGIVVKAPLEKMPFKESNFDLVFSSDVLEHVPDFDVEDSIAELVRVAKKYLVLTINLDHPYEYHPTILPRKIWEELFLKTGKVKLQKGLQQKIEKESKAKYSEYDFFVFEKV